MDFCDKLKAYGELIIKVGVNLQKGELLFISAPVECAEVARTIAAAGYASGAADVTIVYYDQLFDKLRLTNTATETLCDIPQWLVDMRDSIVDKKMCYVVIDSDDPLLNEDADEKKLASLSKAKNIRFKRFYDASMSNGIKWCVVGAPSTGWAKCVFPHLAETEAVLALWELIFDATRVNEKAPIAAWDAHNARLSDICRALNQAKFDTLHYSNSLGTDFTVGLPKGYLFSGGMEKSTAGCVFTANIPTEEVFSAPHKYTATGTLVASMPLCYNGKKISGFSFSFEKGKVVSFTAESGYDVLKELLATDEGASYLGEVALIGYSTPIQNMNTLFYNTLFDENASCHFALGEAYPSCVEGTDGLTDEQLDAMGVNKSLEHVDFMVGTADLKVVGIREGKETVIMQNGDFTAEFLRG